MGLRDLGDCVPDRADRRRSSWRSTPPSNNKSFSPRMNDDIKTNPCLSCIVPVKHSKQSNGRNTFAIPGDNQDAWPRIPPITAVPGAASIDLTLGPLSPTHLRRVAGTVTFDRLVAERRRRPGRACARKPPQVTGQPGRNSYHVRRRRTVEVER